MDKKPPQPVPRLQDNRSSQKQLFPVAEQPRETLSGRRSKAAPDRTDDVIFLRLPDVKEMTGLSKTTLYALIRCQKFPAPVALGERVVAWIKSEVREWAADRIHASRFADPHQHGKIEPRAATPQLEAAPRKSA